MRRLAVITLSALSIIAATGSPCAASQQAPTPVSIGDYGNGTPAPSEVDACPGEVIYYPADMIAPSIGRGDVWICEHSVSFARSAGAELGVLSIDGEVVGYMHEEDDTSTVRLPILPR